MTRENTTPQSELQWLALQYVSGEMTEAQAALFEDQLAEDEAACAAVASAVQTSLTIRQAFETRIEAESRLETASPTPPADTGVTLPARSRTTTSRGARWLSLVASAAAVIVVLGVTHNREPETVSTNETLANVQKLAIAWTQSAEVLPGVPVENPAVEYRITVDSQMAERMDVPLPPVDLVDVPEWLLVGLESQKSQAGTSDEILEN